MNISKHYSYPKDNSLTYTFSVHKFLLFVSQIDLQCCLIEGRKGGGQIWWIIVPQSFPRLSGKQIIQTTPTTDVATAAHVSTYISLHQILAAILYGACLQNIVKIVLMT